MHERSAGTEVVKVETTEEVVEHPKKPKTRDDEFKVLFGVVTNYSRAKRLVAALVGPLGRVWQREGKFQVGEQGPDGNVVLGEGATFPEAFFEATKDLTVDDLMDL